MTLEELAVQFDAPTTGGDSLRIAVSERFEALRGLGRFGRPAQSSGTAGDRTAGRSEQKVIIELIQKQR